MIGAMRRLTLTVCLAALALYSVPALASGGTNRVVGDCTKSQVKPGELILFCGDANALVNHIHWSSFGGAQASGSGIYSFNTCTPNCASGKFKNYSVKLTAAQARPCWDMHDDYRKLSLAFAPGAPYKTKKFTLDCPTG